MALARRDLAEAERYVLDLQRAGAERGVVAFNALPVHLAHGTLDRVAEAGPGAKLSRREVFAIVQRLNGALDHGEPAFRPAAAAHAGRDAPVSALPDRLQ